MRERIVRGRCVLIGKRAAVSGRRYREPDRIIAVAAVTMLDRIGKEFFGNQHQALDIGGGKRAAHRLDERPDGGKFRPACFESTFFEIFHVQSTGSNANGIVGALGVMGFERYIRYRIVALSTGERVK